MKAGEPFEAGTMPLEHEAVAGEQRVSGSPSTAWRALGETVDGAEVGVWEITPGVVTDTEEDEVFVVLSGEGTVRFENGSSVDLAPGTLVRLHEGERTEWEIRTLLRKVYLA